MIARDKFSTAPTALAAVLADLPPNSEVVVFDAGYPAELAARLRALASGYCDVAVPVVHEDEVGNPHFDPAPTGVRRIVTQLGRHCFALSRATALRLGGLDKQMGRRTDLDLGLALQLHGLAVGVTPNAAAVFRRHQDPAVDRYFYDHRWDPARVAAANDRVWATWRIEPAGKACRMRALLEDNPGVEV